MASEPAASSSPTVLVVDDDPETLLLLDKALQRDFEVLTAASGTDALERIERNDVAAIIADYMMPGISGIEVLNRSTGIRPRAARILITASDRINVLRDAVNVARVHRFLSKPLRFNNMPEIVSGAIREAFLEAENARLVTELQEKNRQLTRLVTELEKQQQILEERVAERTRRLEAAVHDLKYQALKDSLTGLFNHGHFHEALEAEVSRSTRHRHDLSLLFIDVDHFKQYNDRMGHPAGDRLLLRLAEIIAGRRSSGAPGGRSSDVAARYGGEEFVVILPETGLKGALTRAERLRSAVASMQIEGGSEQPLGFVSVSIGVSTFPGDGDDRKTLIEVADRGMYAAKRAGRNRVCHVGKEGA
jgi:diguanylate cyclase (GGDEF)-like protein